MPHNSFKDLESDSEYRFKQPPHIERTVENNLRNNLGVFRGAASITELYLTKVFSTFVAFMGGDPNTDSEGSDRSRSNPAPPPPPHLNPEKLPEPNLGAKKK